MILQLLRQRVWSTASILIPWSSVLLKIQSKFSAVLLPYFVVVVVNSWHNFLPLSPAVPLVSLASTRKDSLTTSTAVASFLMATCSPLLIGAIYDFGHKIHGVVHLCAVLLVRSKLAKNHKSMEEKGLAGFFFPVPALALDS